jgi:hypothetical protein
VLRLAQLMAATPQEGAIGLRPRHAEPLPRSLTLDSNPSQMVYGRCPTVCFPEIVI